MRLSSPTKALARIQLLVGMAQSVAANDRDPHRQARLQSILKEAFDVCLASLSGDKLPEKKNHDNVM